MLLGVLQAGGVILERAMERVTDSSPLSVLLVAGTFTLSLVYLCRLAAGRRPLLPAGAEGGPPAVADGLTVCPGIFELEAGLSMAATVAAAAAAWFRPESWSRG